MGDLCELEDLNKDSLARRRAAASLRGVQWAVGDAVEGRWGATRGGAAWYSDRVSRVHDVPMGDGGTERRYDVLYDDGDVESLVLPCHVRERQMYS